MNNLPLLPTSPQGLSTSTDAKEIAAHDDVMSAAIKQLAGRTRNIRLSGALRERFLRRIWPRSAKIIKAWMLWVIVLDLMTLIIYSVFLDAHVAQSTVNAAFLVLPAALASIIMYKSPRPLWFQGTVLLISITTILLSVSLTGVAIGGEFYERHLNVMLSIAITAIIMFPIPYAWTLLTGIIAMTIYLGFQLINPQLELVSALAGTLFFASGVTATLVARRTMSIIDQKGFLLELRDQSRLNELAQANQRLELLSITDPLTGIANRRFMLDTLEKSWTSGQAQEIGASILMCDVDYFKRLNDSLGHAEGDRCLVKIAGIIQSSMRSDQDRVARYGGEEFLVFLPGASENDALGIAETIHERVNTACLHHPSSSVATHVTLSIGVATLHSGDKIMTPELLQSQADIALYHAKHEGRNRIAQFTPSEAIT